MRERIRVSSCQFLGLRFAQEFFLLLYFNQYWIFLCHRNRTQIQNVKMSCNESMILYFKTLLLQLFLSVCTLSASSSSFIRFFFHPKCVSSCLFLVVQLVL